MRNGECIAFFQLFHISDSMLAFEELSFAENFTTSAKTQLPKIIENVQVDSVFDTVHNVIDLKERALNSLTLERLAKKFHEDYHNLEDDQKEAVLVHMATKYYIKGDDLKVKAKEIVNTQGNYYFNLICDNHDLAFGLCFPKIFLMVFLMEN